MYQLSSKYIHMYMYTVGLNILRKKYNLFSQLGERFVASQILEPRLSNFFPVSSQRNREKVLLGDRHFLLVTILNPTIPPLSL